MLPERRPMSSDNDGKTTNPDNPLDPPRVEGCRVSPDETQMAQTTIHEPSFLHPSSIVFEVLTHIRKYVIPAIIGIYGAVQGSTFGLGLAGLILGGSLMITLVRYFTLRYSIQGNDFVVTEGLLFRRIRSVPIRRIQNVDLVQNVLHRVFGVAEVRIETASGKEPEAILRVLTRQQVEQLRNAIFGGLPQPAQIPTEPNETGACAVAESLPQSLTAAAPAISPTVISQNEGNEQSNILLTIPLKQLLAAGAASNRGLVLLGVVVGLIFQGDYASNYRPRVRVDSDTLRAWLPDGNDSYQIALALVVGVVLLLVLLRLVGMAWYVLRFHDYQLTRHGDDLRISCGLLTRVSATVPRQRIQFISVHRPWLMRWMGLASIRLETAGGAGNQSEDAASTVSRRWFVPVIDVGQVPRLLAELRPGLQWQESEVDWQTVSPLTGRRLFRLAVLLSLLVSAIGLGVLRPWGAAAGVVALPLLVLWARKKSRSKHFSRLPWGVAYRSGVFTRKLSFAFYDRVQTLEYSQTPFDRRWKMASLLVDTAAAGPANHRIDIHYLDEQVARQQFDELQFAAATHRPDF